MLELGSWGTVSEAALRFAVFAGVLLVMALLELAAPKRELTHKKARRWFTNLSIVGIDGLAVRLLGMVSAPLTAVAAALYCEAHGYGLFNMLAWPAWLEVLLAVIILDFAIYVQHWASHKVPMLWKIHRMHHADVDIDVTTALRFHPIEIVLSMLYKVVLVFLLGPSALAVVLFEILLNGSAMFNHANVALPKWLDAVVRLLFVTPDMHRVHHSVHHHEHDSNYGFAMSIWDRLFGTYTPQPKDGHRGMTIGLPQWQDPRPTSLWWSLSVPFIGGDSGKTDETKEAEASGKAPSPTPARARPPAE